MKMIALRIVISDIYRDNAYEDDNDNYNGTNFSVFFWDQNSYLSSAVTVRSSRSVQPLLRRAQTSS